MEKRRLVFIVHNHQPAGSAEATMLRVHDDCTLRLVEALERHPSVRAGLHWSGPLLEWMEEKRPETVGRIAALAAAGRVEILGGGWQDPMLGMLPLRDALSQLRMMKRECARLLGVLPKGMWLAERVWEPELAQVIGRAGYAYTFLDDSQLRFAGILDEEVTGHYRTEKGGQGLAIFPISSALRGAVPSGEPDEVLALMGRKPGCVWTYADDGEKLGLLPGTRERVWDKGWMERFLTALEEASGRGEVECLLPRAALESTPSQGNVYLPTCASREMEEWSLPPEAAARLRDLVHSLDSTGLRDSASQFVRGGTWANFLAKYPESNHMHKRMLLASRRLAQKERSDWAALGAPSGEAIAARRSLYRAQTHCPYWHGPHGGITLPRMRRALYRNLVEAENLIEPDGAAPRLATLDFDLDGCEEIMIEGRSLTVILSPSRGCSAIEIDVRSEGLNLVDVLRRHGEAYHRDVNEKPDPPPEIKSKLGTDSAGRFAFHEIIVSGSLRPDDLAAADLKPEWVLADFRNRPFRVVKVKEEAQSAVVLAAADSEIRGGRLTLEKTWFVDAQRGSMAIHYNLKWNSQEPFEGLLVTDVNLSPPRLDLEQNRVIVEEPGEPGPGVKRHLAGRGAIDNVSAWAIRAALEGGRSLDLGFQASPPCALAHHPVETVSRSGHGYEALCQGVCSRLLWDIHLENWNEWKGRVLLSIQSRA